MRRSPACPIPGFRHKRLDRCIGPFPSFLFCAFDQYVLRSCLFLLGARQGFPSSTSHLFLHATACRLRRTLSPSPCRVLPYCLRGSLNPRHPQPKDLEAVPALQGARHPYGLQDALSTLRPPCSLLLLLRHGRKTRYGWLARLYPTGTFTPQDATSFARRETTALQRKRTFNPGSVMGRKRPRPALHG